ncbi:MAG: hypothetical protein H6765_09355 [Candidatus Peribacteria bacterium]|nr:MAG: hypothetical protein H6765_09355 [Candidatus Peribacteria bacterium]
MPNDTDCDTVTTSIVLVYEPVVCTDPITNLTIDSHVNGQTVTDSPITLFGTVVGGVQGVTVTVNGNPYTATVNGQNWSVLVPLNQGNNTIVVTATPSDTDCDPVTTSIQLTYEPVVCTDPITYLDIDSHVNGQVVTSSPVTLFGNVVGGVQSVVVTVNGNPYSATVNGQDWSVIVPLNPGNNIITVAATPTDSDCDPVST